MALACVVRKLPHTPGAPLHEGTDVTQLSIRPAACDDLGAIEAIVREAYDFYIHALGFTPAPLTLDYRRRVGEAQVFVAGAEEPVGVIVLISKPDHLLIENVAVAPPHQGRGVGRALVRYAEETALERGLAMLRLFTNAQMLENLARYERWGFHRTHSSRHGRFTIVHMAKRL
jgi:GNAT superfamily N-acetyltransferase